MKKKRIITHVIARLAKYPFQVITSIIVSTDDETKVPVSLFMNVVVLTAFALIVVEKISDGITQASGPMPKEKNEKYNARPNMTAVELLENVKIISAHVMPGCDKDLERRLECTYTK